MPGGRPLRAEKRTNKLNPHMTPSVEIDPGPHWPPLLSLSAEACWNDDVIASDYTRVVEK